MHARTSSVTHPSTCMQPFGSKIMLRPARRCKQRRRPKSRHPRAPLQVAAPVNYAPLIYRDPYPSPIGTQWDAPHDGNCQWRALNRGLGRAPWQWKSLKAHVLAKWTPAQLRTCGLTRQQSRQVYRALPHYRTQSIWGDKVTLWLSAHKLHLCIDIDHGGYRYRISSTNPSVEHRLAHPAPHKRRIALHLAENHYTALLHTADTGPAVLFQGYHLYGGAGEDPDFPLATLLLLKG